MPLVNTADYVGLDVTIHTDLSAPRMPQKDGAVSAKGFGGVSHNGPLPDRIAVPHDYAVGHHWIELVNMRWQARASGSAANPAQTPPHQFPHADELVLHLRDGDVRYRVVQQPDKYLDGEPADAPGDPAAEVHWVYYAERVS